MFTTNKFENETCSRFLLSLCFLLFENDGIFLFSSVTEREITRGILKAKNVQDHCLAYIREIENINITLLRFASKFVDFAARTVDGEAQKLLKVLRDEKLPAKMPETNLAKFKVEWGGQEGIDVDTHKVRLNFFYA